MSCAVPGCRMVPSSVPYPLDLDIPLEIEGTGFDYMTLRLDLELCPWHAEEAAEAEMAARLLARRSVQAFDDDEQDAL